MKINIDLRYSINTGGISNYIRNISKELTKRGACSYHGCNFWYHGRNSAQYLWFSGRLHQSPIPERIVCNTPFTLPLTYELATGSFADLNLFLTYRLPKLCFQSSVISTIHDIILLKTHMESSKVIEEHRAILERTIKTSAHILTVSEASKQDLVDYFNINPNVISIVHNGIDFDDLSTPLSEMTKLKVKERYGLPEHFILNFGAYRPHKNIERLLQAYAMLPVAIRSHTKLVLTRTNKILDDIIEELKINDDIVKIGFVDEDDKKAIYQMADIVYYASLYEGFGVPIIEAQACGTPVLTSTTSSMPEASGNAAILVDPYNDEEIKDGLLQLLQDNILRNDLITKGRDNAKQYTWQRAAQELESVFTKMKI